MPDHPSPALSNYECGVCGFDDDLVPGDHWCPMCTEARGLDVLMRCNGFRNRDAIAAERAGEAA